MTTPEATTTERRWSPRGASVRARITAAVAVLTAIALSGAGVLLYVLGINRVEDDIPQAVDQEMAELQEFQVQGIDPATRQPFTAIDRLVRVFLQRNVPAPAELMVGVWDGRVRVSSVSNRGGLRNDPAFREAVLSRVRTGGVEVLESRWGDVYVDVLPLRELGGASRDGAFAVAYFIDDELAPLHRILRTYAVTAALALVLVTAAAAYLAGRLLSPVRTLRETADEISETDLSRRIPEVGNDDLTDLTRTFNAMLGRLELAFAGQRAFLDDAGHELRTPLTILRGHLELMDAGDGEDVQRTRELLLDEVDRMARLVEDMILLTKADRPGFLNPKPLIVASLVDGVLSKVKGLADRDWRVDERAHGTLEADEHRMTQALVQLAHNAVKHTCAGDVVALGSAASGDGTIRLWVRDTGPGVPDADKQSIFRRFARGAEDSDHEGVGLGLSIVTAIAHAHGGAVHVEDAQPSGARFVITVPRTRKDPTWPAS